MEALTTPELARACRIFMELAYPGGPDTIPANKRPYFDIAEDRPLGDFLFPAAVCRDISQQKGGLLGYEFRLGSTHFPHIKLRVQQMDLQQHKVWVYTVDTHDGFHQATKYLSAEEAEAWRTMVEQNRSLKHRIEENLTLAGYLTPKNLLQIDLPSATKPSK